MDQHHHQPQLTHDGSPQVFVDTGYAPYTSWEDDTTGYLMYPHLQQTDELRVLNHTNTPSCEVLHFAYVFTQLNCFLCHPVGQDRHQALEYHCSIHMMPPDERDLGSGVYTSSSPRGLIPLSTTPPPQSLNMCDPLSSQNSGSGTSAHGIYHSKGSDTTNSPASFRGTSLPQLYPLHFDNTPSPSSSVRRRTGGYSTFNHDGNSTSNSFAEEVAKKKKEATRKLKAGDEQRRRDSLREAYSRLRVVLGVSDLIIISETSLLEQGGYSNLQEGFSLYSRIVKRQQRTTLIPLKKKSLNYNGI